MILRNSVRRGYPVKTKSRFFPFSTHYSYPNKLCNKLCQLRAGTNGRVGAPRSHFFLSPRKEKNPVRIKITMTKSWTASDSWNLWFPLSVTVKCIDCRDLNSFQNNIILWRFNFLTLYALPGAGAGAGLHLLFEGDQKQSLPSLSLAFLSLHRSSW